MVTLGNPFRSKHNVPSRIGRARIGRRITALYDLLSGPPVSDQERMRATMAAIENSRRTNLIVF